jgi:23S rRNA (guanine745-N1)-methyltransferase
MKLEAAGATMRCVQGHNFDMARDGYINLLGGKALGPLRGDSAEMVTARRAFLGRGHYQPLAEAVAEATAASRPQVVADFGCGEGYYLNHVMKSLEARSAQGYGSDISKPAIIAAAKAYPKLHWIVADTNQGIPYKTHSVDVGICVFAPRNAVEFARVIRPGGHLIIVIPTPDHLLSLRAQFGLLGIEEDKSTKLRDQLQTFHHMASTKVGGDLELDVAAARELIAMTPNARHGTELALSESGEGQRFSTRMEFELLEFVA